MRKQQPLSHGIVKIMIFILPFLFECTLKKTYLKNTKIIEDAAFGIKLCVSFIRLLSRGQNLWEGTFC